MATLLIKKERNLGVKESSPDVYLDSRFGNNYLAPSLNSRYLMRLRSEAIRRRMWFKVLSRIERGLVDLTIKIVDSPRSPKLIEALAKIVVKIRMALMSPITRLMEGVGRPLAKWISKIAVRWGNRNAVGWAEDRGFIKYLTIIDMNNVPGFRLSDVVPSEHP